MSTQHEMEKLSHRQSLFTIFSTTQFLCRQGLSFQGQDNTEGNFIQLLQLRANDIPELSQWLSKRNSWLSHEIQNEIISDFAIEIQRNISNDILQEQYFSFLADGTQDINGNEQLSIAARICSSDYKAKDLFLGFYDLPDSTGKTVSKALKDVALRFNISLDNCRGLGFDGAANMSGSFNGAQAILKSEFPNAHYQHCSNHCLDLCLQEIGREEPIVRNSLELVRNVANFVKESGKRTRHYSEICSDLLRTTHNEDGYTKLQALCPTRWCVRTRAIESVVRNYRPLTKMLHNVCSDTSYSPDSRSKASGFVKQLLKFDTVLGLNMCIEIFSPLEKLANLLQKESLSAGQALTHVKFVTNLLADMRTRDRFSNLYKDCETFCVANDLPEQRPTRLSFLPKWLDENPETTHHSASHEEKIRVSFFSILDRILQSIKKRFDNNFMAQCQEAETTLVKACSGEAILDCLPLPKLFHEIDSNILSSELKMLPTLKRQLNATVTSFNDFINLLKKGSADSLDFFPQTIQLTKLLITFPVTVASVERSFSTLRRLKTWQRSRMSQQRLTSLAVCSMHKDILAKVNLKRLCNRFVERTEERRKTFALFDV